MDITNNNTVQTKFEISEKEIAQYQNIWNDMMLYFQLHRINYGRQTMPMRLFYIHEYTNYTIKNYELNTPHKEVFLKQLEYIAELYS